MKRTLLLMTALLLTLVLQAQRQVYHSTSPEFTVTVPEQGGDGRAVVLVPGGGYNHVAGRHEGADWIPFFTSQGIAVVVTKYTLPAGDREKPLGDIRATFQYLREHGSEWGINPNAIGIMGFSAGGHLAAAYTNSMVGDQRPAFCILMYPVVRLDVRQHLGMAKKFLGDEPSDELRKAWSTNQMVSAETPATILIAADDDPTIDPTNSADYYTALKKKRAQPSTMHIYPRGGHGFGFRTSFPYHERMKQDLTDWLQTVSVPAPKALKVACIGNSITFGAGLKFRYVESYPAQLQALLGNGYWVKNFGVSGATTTDGKSDYKQTPRWQHAKEFCPDIVTIKLGTNDVQPRWWKGEEAFCQNYQQLIDELRALPSKPHIVLCLPVTSFRTVNHLDSDIASKVIPLIRQLAKKNKLDVIDLHTPTADKAALFPDKLHPNAEGEGIIARALYEYIKKM
jgi:acetyl esterase/lipase